MTDAEFEAQKARVLAVIERWQTCLELRWWTRITHEWDRMDAVPGEHGASSRYTAATASVDWRYRIATIHWFLPGFEAMPEDQIEWIVLHEFMHVLLNEMRIQGAEGDCLDHEERVASDLANAFQWTRMEFDRENPTEPDIHGLMSLAVTRDQAGVNRLVRHG